MRLREINKYITTGWVPFPNPCTAQIHKFLIQPCITLATGMESTLQWTWPISVLSVTNPRRLGRWRFRPSPEKFQQFLIFCWPCISIYLFININQLDALNFIISLFQASTCFEHMCSSSGGQKLYYTISGIITLKQVNGLKLLK